MKSFPFQKDLSSREASSKSQKLFLFVKIPEKNMEVYPFPLRQDFCYTVGKKAGINSYLQIAGNGI